MGTSSVAFLPEITSRQVTDRVQRIRSITLHHVVRCMKLGGEVEIPAGIEHRQDCLLW